MVPTNFRDRAFFEPLVIRRTQWQGAVPVELQHATREYRRNPVTQLNTLQSWDLVLKGLDLLSPSRASCKNLSSPD